MSGAYGSRPAGPHDAILPVVLPHPAVRVHAVDPQLGAVLAASGAELDDGRPEVAVALGRLPEVGAPHRVALLGPPEEPGEGARWRDALARARDWGTSSVTAAGLHLSARGARSRERVRWDVEHRLEVAGATVDDRRLAERAPRRAAVVARDRPGAWTSALDAALSAAGVDARTVLAKEALLVVLGSDQVARVTLRAGAGRLAAERDVVTRVGAVLDPPLAALLPAPVGEGDTGLVAWATQRRLRGRPPVAPLSDGVRRPCLDVLAALHTQTGPAAGGEEVIATAERAADRLAVNGADGAARGVLGVARDVAGTLADVPTVWGHGDLWHGNLLVADGQLTGIVDWDGGGPGRFPLEDLVQLVAADRGPGGALGYGRALVDEVLPWAGAGGDEHARRLLRCVGLAPTPTLLRALVAGAWLRRTASQLERYGDRGRRASWVDVNVSDVVAAWAP